MDTQVATRNGEGGLNIGADQLDVIKQSICPAGIPDLEFRLFIEQCKRSGLDPLQKQMFCVKRRQKVGDRWVEKFEAQPAEAGMLARAEKFADFRGIQAAAIYSKDKIEIRPSVGQVDHSFTPFSERGKLLGAWAKADRDGRVPIVAVVSFEERVQDQYNWKKMPETMIVKCARVAVLRVAYPEAFGGLYISEEMPAAESERAQPRLAEPVATKGSGGDSEAQVEYVDETTGEVRPMPNGPVITEPQRKRLFAIAKECWPGDRNAEVYLRELLAKYGFKSTADITRAAYDEIIGEMKAAATADSESASEGALPL